MPSAAWERQRRVESLLLLPRDGSLNLHGRLRESGDDLRLGASHLHFGDVKLIRQNIRDMGGEVFQQQEALGFRHSLQAFCDGGVVRAGDGPLRRGGGTQTEVQQNRLSRGGLGGVNADDALQAQSAQDDDGNVAHDFFSEGWRGDNSGAMEIGLALMLFGYLSGSAPFAILISRAMGLPDPRGYGSGNPGATNVARSGSRSAAILTLFADAAKGALPAWVGGAYFGAEAAALAGSAAAVGHAFPVFLKFKGGKSVATALGVFAAWNPIVLAAALLTWAGTFWVWRISSVSSLSAMMVAAILFMVAAFHFPDSDFGFNGWEIAAGGIFISTLVSLRHKQNIADLISGRERKFRGGK